MPYYCGSTDLARKTWGIVWHCVTTAAATVAHTACVTAVAALALSAWDASTAQRVAWLKHSGGIHLRDLKV